MTKTHITVKFPSSPPSTAELERFLRSYQGGPLTDSVWFNRHRAGYQLDVEFVDAKMRLAEIRVVGVGVRVTRTSFLRALVVTARQNASGARSRLLSLAHHSQS